MKIQTLFLLGSILLIRHSCSQAQSSLTYDLDHFTEADTLRGMLTPERTCYDVKFYELNLEISPGTKSISGSVAMTFTATTDFNRLQIDLFDNLIIDKITYRNQPVKYHRKYNAVFVDLPLITEGSTETLDIRYHGKPIVAANAPWDGGFVWTKDKNKKDWIAVACEGTGASLWWPNKDHLSDEPDSMMIRLTVPAHLTAISNGNLVGVSPIGPQKTRYDWQVSYPINNYNVTLNIGDYVHFTDNYYAADSARLSLDYYVLSNNLKKAKKHFQQVPEMLACYEHYLDKYPFWEDGFALVETPYLGMEHQGAIAYGNQYKRGYMGGMIPADMDWDFIIVHEAGHEYFGNSVSCNDHAEMWIHEAFTTYLEALYVECTSGYADAVRYLKHFRHGRYIVNRKPMVGPLDVNFENFGSSDHYFKGSWVLHTLRHVFGDDELWFKTFKGFYQTYARRQVTTAEVVDYFDQVVDLDLRPIFRQYLYEAKIPLLEYRLEETGDDLLVTYRWEANAGFNMPIDIGRADRYQRIQPTREWQEVRIVDLEREDFGVAEELFLVGVREVE